MPSGSHLLQRVGAGWSGRGHDFHIRRRFRVGGFARFRNRVQQSVQGLEGGRESWSIALVDLWVRKPSEVEPAPDAMEDRTSADRPSDSGDIANSTSRCSWRDLPSASNRIPGPETRVSGLSPGEACGSHGAHALWQLRVVERTLDRNAGGRGHAAQKRDEPVRFTPRPCASSSWADPFRPTGDLPTRSTRPRRTRVQRRACRSGATLRKPLQEAPCGLFPRT